MAHDWKVYRPILQRLEEEVCELSFFIAFSDDHKEVYSARLSDLLLRTCSECENVGKSLCVVSGLVPSGAKVASWMFSEVGNALCSKFAFQKKQLAIIWPYQTYTTASVIPFDTWLPSGSTNPSWFGAYNKLKHDRVAHTMGANVWNAVSALGGLFLLNLCLRELEITQQPEQHDHLAEARIMSYSRFFSPSAFLRIQTRDGLSGPMAGSNLRNLAFDWS